MTHDSLTDKHISRLSPNADRSGFDVFGTFCYSVGYLQSKTSAVENDFAEVASLVPPKATFF